MALRVIIDSNMLEDELLAGFLSASPDNRAVLTDYAWMEAYKQDAASSILKRMSVLRQFSDQVIVLRGTKFVGALDARAPGVAERMIWRGGASEFKETMLALQQMQNGDVHVLAQIIAHSRAAQEQMESILSDAPHIASAMPDMATMFTPGEIRRCGTSMSYTPQMGEKIFAAADQICDGLFKRHPEKPRRPSNRSRPNIFLYRYALATVLYLMKWIGSGSQVLRNRARIRNDFIDLNFATYGTFFNGLMTADRNAQIAHGELRHVLRLRGARMPTDYVEPLLEQLRGEKSCQ